MRKFTGKMPDASPGQAFCASLRSRNAHGHVTGGILRGDLQGKRRTLFDTTSIEQWALTPTVRTLSGDALFGELLYRKGWKGLRCRLSWHHILWFFGFGWFPARFPMDGSCQHLPTAHDQYLNVGCWGPVLYIYIYNYIIVKIFLFSPSQQV